MILGVKVRLESNNVQESKLWQSSGTSRFAYNWALSRQSENYANGGKFISEMDLRKEFTQLKNTDEYNWLYDYSNNITKQAIKDACNAYIRFFKGKSDKPKFKSRRKSKPKFYQDTEKIKFTETHVRIEKVGWVKLSEYGRIPQHGKYTNPRISHDGVHWYVSVGIDIEIEPVELTSESIGIDLGLKDLAVCSNADNAYKNVNKSKRVKKLEKKKRRLQRKVSKKYTKNKKGESYVKTKNIIKLEKDIRKLHKRLDNIRTDYRHKITTEIVKTKPSQIVMESLNVSGMMKNRHLSKAIANQGFYEFKKMIEYKCVKYDIQFTEADTWYPSSKTCSNCGHIKQKLSLSERIFICEDCGYEIDRDKNASINLSRYEAS
jgi:putative transposase